MKDLFSRISGSVWKTGRGIYIGSLKKSPFPEDILALGEDGLKEIWRAAKLKGCSYSKAGRIVRYAGESVGLTDGTEAGKKAVRLLSSEL